MKKFTFLLLITLCLLLVSNLSFAQPGYINTIAGNNIAGYSGNGGPATAAELHSPIGLAMDAAGNLFISDGNNNVIRQINTSGIITIVAGTGTSGYTGNGGPATTAELDYPFGVTVDYAENIYFVDQGNMVVRKVNTSGIITTVAGGGTITGLSSDGGPATDAKLNMPSGLTVDASGNIYITDQFNNAVRKVNNAGIITTVAGNGTQGYSGDGGPATAAELYDPAGVIFDVYGNLYIADFGWGSGVVRKVDTSGIITTAAGNGIQGYSGDGGPASSAELNAPIGLAIDLLGNLYIADRDNNVVRKVNTSGIITTYAGNHIAGYSGNDGPATAAKLDYPWALAVDPDGNLYIADASNNVIREIQNAPTHTSDSFSVSVVNSCTGLGFQFITNTYSAAQNIKTYFGNGTFIDTAVSAAGVNGIASCYEPYMSGTYSLKHVLYDGTTAVDSISYSIAFAACQNFNVMFYYDANDNCIKDSGEIFNTKPILVAVYNNAVPVDTISCTSGFYYTAYGGSGDIYSFLLLPPAGLSFTCPASGIIYDTILFGVSSSTTKLVGLQCSSGSQFDLAVYDVIPVTGEHDEWGNVYASNNLCAPANATVTVHYSKLYNVDEGGGYLDVNPAPTSYTDSTITWNVSDLSSSKAPVDLYYAIWTDNACCGYLTPGTPIPTYVTITPIIGDVDTSNNDCQIWDTVKAGCDPNEISVFPAGCIPVDTPMQLQYTINFVNTGNDTAFNIYIMDTLSTNVNSHSLKMLMSSATMNIYQFSDGINDIVKFDFPNINLLDSAFNSQQCSGAIIFNVNTMPGLPEGTKIFNHAGIFFDDNPVVTTNTVEDIMGGCTPASVNNSPKPTNGNVFIFPNPATTSLSIIMSPSAYTSFTITNSIGQDMIQQPLTTTQTTVNVATLPPGLYYITFRGDNGTTVQKFVKL